MLELCLFIELLDVLIFLFQSVVEKGIFWFNLLVGNIATNFT